MKIQGDQDKVFYENLTAEESIEQGDSKFTFCMAAFYFFLEPELEIPSVFFLFPNILYKNSLTVYIKMERVETFFS